MNKSERRNRIVGSKTSTLLEDNRQSAVEQPLEWVGNAPSIDPRSFEMVWNLLVIDSGVEQPCFQMNWSVHQR